MTTTPQTTNAGGGEAMRFDIEEGNFSDVLLEKIGCGERTKDIESSSSFDAQSLTNNNLNLLQKLQIQQV